MKRLIRPISYSYALLYFGLADWLRPRLASENRQVEWWLVLCCYLLVPWLIVFWKAVREYTTTQLLLSQLAGLAILTVALILAEPTVENIFPNVWIPRSIFVAMMICFFGLLFYSKRFLTNTSKG